MSGTLLISGNERRHRFVAGVLASALDLRAIVAEGKVPTASIVSRSDGAESEVVRAHFANRDATESRLLGEVSDFPAGVDVLRVEHGQSNRREVFEWVTARRPEVVLLFGSSIIKPPLLSAFDGRMVNMHLGLSPYYRGSGTNFWPLVDRLPECVGVTIHLATLAVDAGDMLAQARPEDVGPDDGAHELGTKAIITGVHMLARIIPEFAAGRVTPVVQQRNVGRLCRRSDFSADAVRAMHANFTGGMMPEYLADKVARDARLPIVEPPALPVSRPGGSEASPRLHSSPP